ncbi:MAG: amidohydrolase family protein [Gemmobacter sp.]|nr:amidohydrolase family protein [Gemmobacter sp.]
MHHGLIIDTFLHGPWIGGDIPGGRADQVDWLGDRRLRRVMRTFDHVNDRQEKTDHMTMPEVLAALDRSGVGRGILAAKVYYVARPEAVLDLNRHFAALCAQEPNRFKWIASVIPPELGASSYWDVMQNTRMLDALAGLPGLCGIHITPSPWGILPNDRWFYPVYAKCVELGLPVFTYVGAPGPLWPMLPNDPALLDDVALAFPDLKIIAHHIGDPWTEISVRMAARHENFYICTSAWSPKAYPEPLMRFLRGKWHGVRGCDKVVFASDYPLMDLDRTVRDARAMDLTPDQLAAFLCGTAERLFWGAP